MIDERNRLAIPINATGNATSVNNVPELLWSAIAGWLASRTLDPRVVRSNPGLFVTCTCVPGQNTSPQIAPVLSARTLTIVGPFYLVSLPGEVYNPTRVI